MKLWNKIYDYLFDVHGRLALIVGLVVLAVFVVIFFL